jgi:benzoate 4-monooxygenase
MRLNQDKLRKLQAELNAAFPSPLPADWVSSFVECKDVPYVNSVVYETLRLRTVGSVSLTRVVSKGGAQVCGGFFEAGTVLSTPTYTTPRSASLWGKCARL